MMVVPAHGSKCAWMASLVSSSLLRARARAPQLATHAALALPSAALATKLFMG